MRSILVFFLLTIPAWQASADSDPTAMPPSEPSLAGSYWWVEDIAGEGVVDASHTTIGFLDALSVAGDSSCNRYRGSYMQDGDTLKFGALAGTLRACHQALMNQEQRFYKALEQVVSWRVEPTGLLYLLGPDGKVLIRASATDQDNI